jgi:hypothetical protein
MDTNFRFGIIERLAVAAFLAGVAGIVATLSLPPAIQEALVQSRWGPYLFWTSLVVVSLTTVFFICDLALYVAVKLGASVEIALVYIGFGLMAAGAVVGTIGAVRMDSSKQTGVAKRPPEKTANPPSYVGKLELKEIFSPEGPQPKIQIGNSGVFIVGADQYGQLLFPALRRDQFRVEVADGKLFVSTKVTDSTGKITVEIIRNEWKVAPPPNTWDRNYSTDALEVKDPQGRIVLQVRLMPDRIQLQGAWKLGPEWQASTLEFVIIRANPSGQGAQISFFPRNPRPEAIWPEVEPLFLYPSEFHLGEFR